MLHVNHRVLLTLDDNNFFQENELVPPILAAGMAQLQEDDEYIAKLLSAQNFMVQIQVQLRFK